MQTFIKNCLEQIKAQTKDISQSKFILPSRRACTFLKEEIANQNNNYSFLPEIVSIENFIEEVSSLKLINNTETQFYLYQAYLNTTPKSRQETYETFSKWAQVLIHDFNEIDRYKIDPKQFFTNLANTKQLENWIPNQAQPTDIIKNYLSFWEDSHLYYNELTQLLTKNNVAYQGLQYREATEQLEIYIQNNPNQHYFIGFNALNKCEELIINEFLTQEKGNAFWDIDKQLLSQHNAGIFLNNYQKNWSVYKNQTFNTISNHFSEAKNISVHAIAKNIGQIKKVGEILNNLNLEELKDTAVVLGDESLLEPLLNSLPNNVKEVNITMGLPLKNIPLATFFELVLLLHKHKKNNLFYHKDVLKLLSNKYSQLLINKTSLNKLQLLINHSNTSFISTKDIESISDSDYPFRLIFNNNLSDIAEIHLLFKRIIILLKERLDLNKNQYLLDLEYTYRFNQIFNQLELYQNKFNVINQIDTYYNIYKDLLNNQTLDLQGEPVKGLQIMGMLETRAIDFKRIIITSVNEGTLPSGKSLNSFIPFDLKIAYQLPTYKEKDAIYAYHFFRLLQRADDIYILHNTEADGLNSGEKSRFILQLENIINNNHNYSNITSSPKTHPIIKQELSIKKTETVIDKIDLIAKKGFSPSALTQYIRNPIDFYTQKVLDLYDEDVIEETVAYNTLGTIVHNTLESFYKPIINSNVTKEYISGLLEKIDAEVNNQFKNLFKQGNIHHGKNFLIYNVAKRYVYNFLQYELKQLQLNNSITIKAIEADYKVPIFIPKLNKTVYLRGKVDRIDEVNGITRIIDYKTGLVKTSELHVKDWELLKDDYKKHSKAFQVLCYAYMMHKESEFNTMTHAGIISFKNMQSGFISFKENRSPEVTKETINKFEIILRDLITELYNLEQPFIEKETN